MSDKTPKATTGGEDRKGFLRPLLVIGGLLVIVLAFLVIPRLGGAEEPTDEQSPSAVAPGNGSESPTSDAPSATPTASASASETPSLSPGGQDMAPTMEDWRPVAEEFATAWANPEGGKDAWLKRLRPLTSDDAYEGLESTNEAAIPDLTFVAVEENVVNGNQVAVDASYEGQGKVLRMGLLPDGTSWEVVYVAEAD